LVARSAIGVTPRKRLYVFSFFADKSLRIPPAKKCSRLLFPGFFSRPSLAPSRGSPFPGRLPPRAESWALSLYEIHIRDSPPGGEYPGAIDRIHSTQESLFVSGFSSVLSIALFSTTGPGGSPPPAEFPLSPPSRASTSLSTRHHVETLFGAPSSVRPRLFPRTFSETAELITVGFSLSKGPRGPGRCSPVLDRSSDWLLSLRCATYGPFVSPSREDFFFFSFG